MTVAVCSKCGGFNLGALIKCPDCDFAPKEPEDIARSMILTDHHFDSKELGVFGERIKSGESISYDAEQFAGYIEFIKSDPIFLERVQHPERFPPSILDRIGCVVLPWTVFIAILALAGFAIIRFIQTW